MKYQKIYFFHKNKVIFCLILFWGSVKCNPNCNFYVKRESCEYEMCVCVYEFFDNMQFVKKVKCQSQSEFWLKYLFSYLLNVKFLQCVLEIPLGGWGICHGPLGKSFHMHTWAKHKNMPDPLQIYTPYMVKTQFHSFHSIFIFTQQKLYNVAFEYK